MIARSDVRSAAAGCAALLVAACSLGCSRTARFATISDLPDEPRRAPGVALDPETRLPAPASSAASAERLLVLRTPRGNTAAKRVVLRFFDAVTHENAAELDELFSDESSVELRSQGSRQSAKSFWNLRLSRLSYDALSDGAVLRERRLELYTARDAARLAGRRPLPVALTDEQIAVRAPIARTHVGKVRVFGDEIVFLLSPRGADYEISLMIEDFTMP